MVQGRNKVLASFIVAATLCLALAACSGKKVRAPDCFDCTEQKQSWDKFSWNQLEGSWKGSLESVTNIVTAAKKEHQEDPVEVSFLDGQKFLSAKNIEHCGDFPAKSVVFMGQLWRERDKMTGLDLASGKIVLPQDKGRSLASVKKEAEDKVYEVFGASSEDKVSYGRATISRMNGQNICTYARIGGSFFQNRLALPSLSFTQRVTHDGRVLASGSTPEYEVSMEFLDYRPAGAKQVFPVKNARRPAAVEMHDQPQLFLRVFKIARNVTSVYSRGEWTGTQEYLYRLWRN